MGSTVFERQPAPESVITHSLQPSILKPFWIDDAKRSDAQPAFSGNAFTDLAIVGGGYTGLWTALLAKERDPDRRVVLLEAKSCGWAASGRNGGFIEATLTHGESNGRTRYPNEYDELDRLGLENLDEIEQTVAKRKWNVDFERSGALTVATEQYQVDDLREAAHGDREVFLDEAEIRARVNSPTYLAALFAPRDNAIAHPSKLGNALMDAALNAGVEIFENSPVTSVTDLGAEIELATKSGKVTAKRVALATNAFPSLLKRYRLHTVPVYDYVLMSEPLSSEQLASIGWSGREGIADSANQFHYYRLSKDNRILFGGYDAVYHFGGKIRSRYNDRTESYRLLASHFFTTFPQLEGLQFTHRWAGVIDTCSRFSAFFAQAYGGKVSYTAGFTGLGVAATRFAANVMLDRLEGLTTQRTELEMVKSMPLPFPPEPLTFPAVQAVRFELDRADHNAGKRSMFLRTLDAVGLGFDS
jgi:glycine/D-amino acid oxidase-like deaminating enzyme